MDQSELEIMKEPSIEIEFGESKNNNKEIDEKTHFKTNFVFPRQKENKLALSQIRAIFYKNLRFQMQQTSNNLFQIFIPFLCILLIWTAKYEMMLNMKAQPELNKVGTIPFFINLPNIIDKDSTINPISSSDCYKWFLVKSDISSINQQFDVNDLVRPQFPQYCSRSQSSVPFIKHTNETMNEYLFDKMKEIDKNPLNFGEEIKDLEIIPDGGFVFKNVTNNQLDVDLFVNDLLFVEYHRSNGFSKFSFRIPKSPKNLYNDVKNSFNTTSNQTLFQQISSVFIKNITLKNASGLIEEASQGLNKTTNAIRKYFSVEERGTTLPVY